MGTLRAVEFAESAITQQARGRKLRAMYYPDSAVFVTGVAKVGKEDAINAMYGNFSMSLIVDTSNDTIIGVSCNMVMQDTVEFVRYLVIGSNIITEIDTVCESIRRRFFALSQKAVIAALKDAQNRYLMSVKQVKETQ